MQTAESILSLLVFASMLIALLPAAGEPASNDDTLYRMQLANDAWRVLYLRGDFEGFGEGKRERIEKDINEIGEQTSLCVFFDGTWSTNCRGGNQGHGMSIRMRRMVVDGGSPRLVRFSLGN